MSNTKDKCPEHPSSSTKWTGTILRCCFCDRYIRKKYPKKKKKKNKQLGFRF